MQPVQSPKFSAELPLHSYIQCVVELALEVYSMFSLLLLPPLRARSDLAGWSRSLVHYQPGGLSVHLRRVFVHSIRLAGLFLSLFRRVSYKYKIQKWLAGFRFPRPGFPHIQARSKSSLWLFQQSFLQYYHSRNSLRCIHSRVLSHNSLTLLPLLCITFSKRPELRKDHQILHHRAQTANQPRQVRPHVLLLQTMTQDPRAVSGVA